MLVIISFVPTLLTDSHNLQITEGDEFIIQDIPPDEDGVSQTSSEATCQDGPSNLHPPDSDSQPCFPFRLVGGGKAICLLVSHGLWKLHVAECKHTPQPNNAPQQTCGCVC